MKDEESEQIRLLRKQLRCMKGLCIGMGMLVLIGIVSAALIVPRTVSTLKNVTEITGQLNSMNLEEVINDMDTLAQTSEKSISETTEKLDQLDIESLNKAIQNLSDVVSPLANLFGGSSSNKSSNSSN